MRAASPRRLVARRWSPRPASRVFSSPLPSGEPRLRCVLCGGTRFVQRQVLWPALVEQWGLTEAEVSYINRQQGLHCAHCGMTLRSLALANAIMRLFGAASSFPLFMLRHPLLRVLEVNPAGTLHRALRRMPRAVTTHYPEVDMTALPFSDESFDLVVHSDTLEHVPDPVRGLAECLRVVRRRGWVCFTVPVIVERLTRARSGLPPSFHGGPQAGDPGYLVHTEYGADMWTHAMEAGASDCRILALEYPSAMAIAARR